MSKKNICVVFGGKSTEHDVSIVTGVASVVKPLQLLQKYNVEVVYISKEGTWYWADELQDIEMYSSGRIHDFLKILNPVEVELKNGLVLKNTNGFKQKEYKVDVVFPATHGTFGEDGSLMGTLRMFDVAYVGCDMEASVIAMNKLLSHQVAQSHGVEQHSYIGVSRQDYQKGVRYVSGMLEDMAFPLFVKPVHLGSSIGITQVKNLGELENALEIAFHFDSQVIIEEAVKNLIEVTVPVMGETDDPKVGLVERPMLGDSETFDFDTKYMKNKKSKTGGGKASGSQGYSELPAKINKELYEKSEELAKKIYTITGCYGIARIDMLIDSKTEKVYFNEINPLPGSLYVHNWRASGVATVDLVDELIKLALKRHIMQKNTATAFSTNYLAQY